MIMRIRKHLVHINLGKYVHGAILRRSQQAYFWYQIVMLACLLCVAPAAALHTFRASLAPGSLGKSSLEIRNTSGQTLKGSGPQQTLTDQANLELCGCVCCVVVVAYNAPGIVGFGFWL